MAERRLPNPVTATDQLLLAVVEELVGLRADLQARGGKAPARAQKSGAVELTEPRPARTAASSRARKT